MQPLDLESSVAPQSWDWLVELALRLNVVIEVIDAHDVSVSPVGSTPDAVALRGMLATGEPTIRGALSVASRSKTPVPIVVGDMRAAGFPLTPGGMLLLARRLAPGESSDECREDLDSIGTWLTGAIEATLAQPTAISVEGYRIMSFRRILREAAARGSLRRVVGAFVEALSVWDDVRVRTYVAGATGGLFEYASSMDAPPSSSPEPLDESIVPRNGRMIRLSRADVDRAGLVTDPGDVLILRMEIGTDSAWALVFSGMISECVQVRLRVYSDILRESLNDVLSATTTRLVAELARRPIPPGEPLENAALNALRQLTAAVGGHQAALVVTTTAGRPALSVGNQELAQSTDRTRLNRMFVRSSDAGGVMTVVIEHEHAPFTACDREIVHAGVAAMHPWIGQGLNRSNGIERRRNFQPVDALFDQLATEAVAAGQQASVIVMSITAARVRPGLLPAWVGRIRGRLREGDRAGMLSDREIAVLLCGASAEQAAAVSARLKQLVESAVHPTIGLTTRVPDAPFEGSLVGSARAAADR